jgi:PleD family two-component response regulator
MRQDMNVAVVDESRKRRRQIVEALQKMNHTVTEATTSQDLITLVEERRPERMLLDVGTWKNGRAIYNYFRIGKKLAGIPILFYNSYEGFNIEAIREPHDKDRVVNEPAKVEDIISAVEQNV